jgi:rhomboid-like protein
MHIGLGGELLLTRKFSLALGGGGYLFAAAYTNEDTRRWSERLGAGSWWRKGKAQPTDREITRAKTMEGAKVCF